MKRQIYLFFIAMLGWGLLVAPFDAAQAGDSFPKIPQMTQLARKAADSGTVRVIVALNVPDIEIYSTKSAQIKAGLAGPAEQGRAAVADAALKFRITDTAEGLMATLAPAGARTLRRYDAFPLVAMDVSVDALEKMGRSSLVRHVAEDRLARPFLGDTVDIVGASAAWAGGYTGAGWSVAILDTGILSSHEFFAGKTITEACFSTSGHCPNAETSMTGTGAAAHHPSTYYGYDHGTHVAGIAAGYKSGGSLAGVAKDADIVAVQVFSRFDNSEYCAPETDCVLSYTSDQLKALDFIYSLRATTNIAAVNLSLGSGAYTSNCDEYGAIYKLAVDQLREVGIATIVASGNVSQCNAISEPACISSVISVGAAGDTDAMASFSNYQAGLLDLFAPGVGVESAVATSDTAYESWSGTSMATPHVTGVFALLRQKDGTASVDHLLDALVDTGAPVTGSVDCGTDAEVLPIPRVQVDDAMDWLDLVPVAPSELAVAASASDQIQLTWTDNATDESGFKIERSDGDGNGYTQIAAVGADSGSYTDSTLSDGTSYAYRVRAYNGHGASDYCSAAEATTPLPAPDDLEANAGDSNWIELAWTDTAENESGFKIARRPGDSGTFSQVATVGAGTTEYTDSALSEETTYTYRVKAYNDQVDSAYSTTAGATTPLAVPENLSATAVSTARIDLTWADRSAIETGFEIQRSTDDSTGFALVAALAADVENYSDTSGLSAAATYFYRIRTTNQNGASVYSDTVQVTTQTSYSVSNGGSGGGGGGGCFISAVASD